MARYGYVGESLEALVTRTVKEATDRCARRIAQRGQDIMFETARDATPIRSGRTRDSWIRHEIEQRDSRLEGRISNSDPRALWLQYGTQEHEIRPKDRRALREGIGPRAGAHVRGITAHHMTQRAALIAETSIGLASEQIRREWSAEVEAAIEQGKRNYKTG